MDVTVDHYYYCGHGRRGGKYSKCSKEQLPANKIEGEVFNSLKNVFHVLKYLGKKVEQQHKQQLQLYREQDVIKLDAEIKMLKAKKIRQYEAYAEGKVSREIYLHEKQALTDKLNILITERDSAEDKKTEKIRQYNEIKEVTDLAEEFLGEKELTKEMVDAFVETVYVYTPMQVEIVFKFEDEMKLMMEKYKLEV